ncbi:3-oxoacyl-ACP reductase [Mameliella alba]|nr:3-oxoacyl-ACP reductase [Mameliella alba]
MSIAIDLTGRRAIVCASSSGLGRGCAEALARAGASVVLNGRDETRLKQTAIDLVSAETGVDVIPVAGDITDPDTQERLLEACPEPDILVNNNGGPPIGDFRTLDRADMEAGLRANMLAPIEMIQRVIDGMAARRFGRIVNITSVTVKMPISGLDLSSGARAGLTSFLAGIARDVAGDNVTINQLMPGYFDTERSRGGCVPAPNALGARSRSSRPNALRPFPPGAWGRPPNSATPALSCAARRPASLLVRTC